MKVGECSTCSKWTAQKWPVGRCNADHRFWKTDMGDGSFVMSDSFFPEYTRHNGSCGAWSAKGDV